MKTTPIINTLFKFIPSDSKYDEKGNLVSIGGVHKRLGKISDEMAEKFALSGIKESRYKFMTLEPSKFEQMTYTGMDIETYGM